MFANGIWSKSKTL